MNKLKLTIELVPNDCFEKNLRHMFSQAEWDIIRKHTYKRYAYKCAICEVSNCVLSAHEKWEYKILKNRKGKQKLVNILSLCNDCHMIKHIAFADMLARQGKLDMRKLINHFYRVNNCGVEEFALHYNEEVKRWNEIADVKFTIDISYVYKLGLNIEKK